MELTLSDFGYFKVYQPKSGYHFSSEPFVLTCDLEFSHPKVFVDFGSGCGIIAVVLALKNPASFVYAVERCEDYLEVIEKNFIINGIKNAKAVKSERDVPTNSVDFFLSNPPYFITEKYRVSQRYRFEKFEVEPISSVVGIAKRVLVNKGVLRVSFHSTRILELVEALKFNSFGLKSITAVHGSPKKSASFLMVEAKLASHDFVIFKPPLFLDEFNPVAECGKAAFEK